MKSVATYVFIDLETTGLPAEELNKTKITELSMVAVSKRHILAHTPKPTQEIPRVKHKLTLCFNPGRMVSPDSTRITGLCNDLLESASYFNLEVFATIETFLGVLEKPICLVAHNGLAFDFPILKNHFVKLNKSLSSDVLCADSLHCLRDIVNEIEVDTVEVESNVCIKRPRIETNTKTNVDTVDLADPNESNEELQEQLAMKLQNEATPKTPKIVRELSDTVYNARRRLFSAKKSERPFSLENVYKQFTNRQPMDTHQAESDCLMTLAIATVLKDHFVKWVDNNCRPFTDVNPMRLGVKLGK